MGKSLEHSEFRLLEAEAVRGFVRYFLVGVRAWWLAMTTRQPLGLLQHDYKMRGNDHLLHHKCRWFLLERAYS